MGRPKKQIDKETFEGLCGIQCTEEEICAVLNVDDMTLARWCKEVYGMSFSEVFKQKRTGGKASLRRNQWRLSETNPTMAIWLGKQYLGQRDSFEDERASKETLAKLDEILCKVDGVI